MDIGEVVRGSEHTDGVFAGEVVLETRYCVWVVERDEGSTKITEYPGAHPQAAYRMPLVYQLE